MGGSAAQIIDPSVDGITFFNLTKTATTANRSLSFAGYTDTPFGIVSVTGKLTLKGTAAGYVVLNSSNGTPWRIDPIDPIGTLRDVDYVNVAYSNNINETPIGVAHGVDSLNNTGWDITGLVAQATTTVVTSTGNPLIYGLPVEYTADVTVDLSPATVLDVGTVTFFDNGVALPGCINIAVAANLAECDILLPATGLHPITAIYTPASFAYLTSTSSALNQVVNQPTTMKLTTSANPSLEGDSVTFIATFTNSGLVSGTVAFKLGDAGGVDIVGCEAVVVSGNVAKCATTALPQGSNAITAVLTPALYFLSSSDGLAQPQVVNQRVSIALVSSGNPIKGSQTITFTATVSPSSVTGTVAFSDGEILISSCAAQPITGGVATCTVKLGLGAHIITAVYVANGVSDLLLQTVDPLLFYLPSVGK
jgi:hypothetical protein